MSRVDIRYIQGNLILTLSSKAKVQTFSVQVQPMAQQCYIRLEGRFRSMCGTVLPTFQRCKVHVYTYEYVYAWH